MSFSLNTDFGDNFVTGSDSVKGLGAFIDSELCSRWHVDLNEAESKSNVNLLLRVQRAVTNAVCRYSAKPPSLSAHIL
jgi:hypothetical protein